MPKDSLHKKFQIAIYLSGVVLAVSVIIFTPRNVVADASSEWILRTSTECEIHELFIRIENGKLSFLERNVNFAKPPGAVHHFFKERASLIGLEAMEDFLSYFEESSHVDKANSLPQMLESVKEMRAATGGRDFAELAELERRLNAVGNALPKRVSPLPICENLKAQICGLQKQISEAINPEYKAALEELEETIKRQEEFFSDRPLPPEPTRSYQIDVLQKRVDRAISRVRQIEEAAKKAAAIRETAQAVAIRAKEAEAAEAARREFLKQQDAVKNAACANPCEMSVKVAEKKVVACADANVAENALKEANAMFKKATNEFDDAFARLMKAREAAFTPETLAALNKASTDVDAAYKKLMFASQRIRDVEEKLKPARAACTFSVTARTAAWFFTDAEKKAAEKARALESFLPNALRRPLPSAIGGILLGVASKLVFFYSVGQATYDTITVTFEAIDNPTKVRNLRQAMGDSEDFVRRSLDEVQKLWLRFVAAMTDEEQCGVSQDPDRFSGEELLIRMRTILYAIRLHTQIQEAIFTEFDAIMADYGGLFQSAEPLGVTVEDVEYFYPDYYRDALLPFGDTRRHKLGEFYRHIFFDDTGVKDALREWTSEKPSLAYRVLIDKDIKALVAAINEEKLRRGEAVTCKNKPAYDIARTFKKPEYCADTPSPTSGPCGSIAGYYCGDSSYPAHLFYQMASGNSIDVTPARPIPYLSDPNRNCVVTCGEGDIGIGRLCLLIPGNPPTRSCRSRNDSLTPQAETVGSGAAGAVGRAGTAPPRTHSGNDMIFDSATRAAVEKLARELLVIKLRSTLK